MADGVCAVGNLVMTEGTKTKTQVIFTGNTVKAHSRVAFAGPGDNTVITDNVIDLMGEQYAGGGRTSMIGLTATAETGDVVITGNEFRNANRVLAVDNAPNMPADKLIFQNNKPPGSRTLTGRRATLTMETPTPAKGSSMTCTTPPRRWRGP